MSAEQTASCLKEPPKIVLKGHRELNDPLWLIQLVTAVNSNLNNDAVNGDLNTLGGEIVETRVESPVGADSLKDRVKPSGGAIPVLYLNKKKPTTTFSIRRDQIRTCGCNHDVSRSDVVNCEYLAVIMTFPIRRGQIDKNHDENIPWMTEYGEYTSKS